MKKKLFLTDKLRQSGITLIEVLISMLIISFAVVGAAALQIETLRNSVTMEHRAQAIFLANDILERMRASKKKDADELDEYIVSVDASPGEDDDDEVQPAPQTCAPADGGGSVVAHDLQEWGCLVTTTLPTGSASIAVTDQNLVVLNFGWVQRPLFNMGNAQNMNFVIEARI